MMSTKEYFANIKQGDMLYDIKGDRFKVDLLYYASRGKLLGFRCIGGTKENPRVYDVSLGGVRNHRFQNDPHPMVYTRTGKNIFKVGLFLTVPVVHIPTPKPIEKTHNIIFGGVSGVFTYMDTEDVYEFAGIKSHVTRDKGSYCVDKSKMSLSIYNNKLNTPTCLDKSGRFMFFDSRPRLLIKIGKNTYDIWNECTKLMTYICGDDLTREDIDAIFSDVTNTTDISDIIIDKDVCFRKAYPKNDTSKNLTVWNIKKKIMVGGANA